MTLNPRAPQFYSISNSPHMFRELDKDLMPLSYGLGYEFPYTLRSIPISSLQTTSLASPTNTSPYPNRYSPQLRTNSPYPNGRMMDGKISEQLPQFTSVLSEYIHRPHPQPPHHPPHHPPPIYHPQPLQQVPMMLPPGLSTYMRQ